MNRRLSKKMRCTDPLQIWTLDKVSIRFKLIVNKVQEAGKKAFKRNGNSSSEKFLKSKIEELQRIIGKITIQNEILKKQKR